MFNNPSSNMVQTIITLLHLLSFLVLQNIPLAKAVEMVLAGQGEEQSLGMKCYTDLDVSLARKYKYCCSTKILERTIDLFAYRS